MNDTYLTTMIESLEKKDAILTEIMKKDSEQAALLKEEDFSFDKYDKTVEEKDVLIFRLEKLDDGFESLYNKVKEELDANRALYTSQIRRMQELIGSITDKSASIQAEEARNKAALENVFRSEREKLRAGRSGVKALKSYNQAMNFRNDNT
ncbi:MAG: flagellar protein FliT [Lachnospiraceae bacterium]|nr:flagellar protein FliT [Lachnospiraceae bacterium]MBO4824271.1 flagellar protein FliT [Lachnospiraceae bacterium]